MNLELDRHVCDPKVVGRSWRVTNEHGTVAYFADRGHAARCVRACNSFDELLAFAHSVAMFRLSSELGITERTPIQKRLDERIEAARAVIARAESQP